MSILLENDVESLFYDDISQLDASTLANYKTITFIDSNQEHLRIELENNNSDLIDLIIEAKELAHWFFSEMDEVYKDLCEREKNQFISALIKQHNILKESYEKEEQLRQDQHEINEHAKRSSASLFTLHAEVYAAHRLILTKNSAIALNHEVKKIEDMDIPTYLAFLEQALPKIVHSADDAYYDAQAAAFQLPKERSHSNNVFTCHSHLFVLNFAVRLEEQIEPEFNERKAAIINRLAPPAYNIFRRIWNWIIRGFKHLGAWLGLCDAPSNLVIDHETFFDKNDDVIKNTKEALAEAMFYHCNTSLMSDEVTEDQFSSMSHYIEMHGNYAILDLSEGTIERERIQYLITRELKKIDPNSPETQAYFDWLNLLARIDGPYKFNLEQDFQKQFLAAYNRFYIHDIELQIIECKDNEAPEIPVSHNEFLLYFIEEELAAYHEASHVVTPISLPLNLQEESSDDREVAFSNVNTYEQLLQTLRQKIDENEPIVLEEGDTSAYFLTAYNTAIQQYNRLTDPKAVEIASLSDLLTKRIRSVKQTVLDIIKSDSLNEPILDRTLRYIHFLMKAQSPEDLEKYNITLEELTALILVEEIASGKRVGTLTAGEIAYIGRLFGAQDAAAQESVVAGLVKKYTRYHFQQAHAKNLYKKWKGSLEKDEVNDAFINHHRDLFAQFDLNYIAEGYQETYFEAIIFFRDLFKSETSYVHKDHEFGERIRFVRSQMSRYAGFLAVADPCYKVFVTNALNEYLEQYTGQNVFLIDVLDSSVATDEQRSIYIQKRLNFLFAEKASDFEITMEEITLFRNNEQAFLKEKILAYANNIKTDFYPDIHKIFKIAAITQQLSPEAFSDLQPILIQKFLSFLLSNHSVDVVLIQKFVEKILNNKLFEQELSDELLEKIRDFGSLKRSYPEHWNSQKEALLILLASSSILSDQLSTYLTNPISYELYDMIHAEIDYLYDHSKGLKRIEAEIIQPAINEDIVPAIDKRFRDLRQDIRWHPFLQINMENALGEQEWSSDLEQFFAGAGSLENNLLMRTKSINEILLAFDNEEISKFKARVNLYIETVITYLGRSALTVEAVYGDEPIQKALQDFLNSHAVINESVDKLFMLFANLENSKSIRLKWLKNIIASQDQAELEKFIQQINELRGQDIGNEFIQEDEETQALISTFVTTPNLTNAFVILLLEELGNKENLQQFRVLMLDEVITAKDGDKLDEFTKHISTVRAKDAGVSFIKNHPEAQTKIKAYLEGCQDDDLFLLFTRKLIMQAASLENILLYLERVLKYLFNASYDSFQKNLAILLAWLDTVEVDLTPIKVLLEELALYFESKTTKEDEFGLKDMFKDAFHDVFYHLRSRRSPKQTAVTVVVESPQKVKLNPVDALKFCLAYIQSALSQNNEEKALKVIALIKKKYPEEIANIRIHSQIIFYEYLLKNPEWSVSTELLAISFAPENTLVGIRAQRVTALLGNASYQEACDYLSFTENLPEKYPEQFSVRDIRDVNKILQKDVNVQLAMTVAITDFCANVDAGTGKFSLALDKLGTRFVSEKLLKQLRIQEIAALVTVDRDYPQAKKYAAILSDSKKINLQTLREEPAVNALFKDELSSSFAQLFANDETLIAMRVRDVARMLTRPLNIVDHHIRVVRKGKSRPARQLLLKNTELQTILEFAINNIDAAQNSLQVLEQLVQYYGSPKLYQLFCEKKAFILLEQGDLDAIQTYVDYLNSEEHKKLTGVTVNTLRKSLQKAFNTYLKEKSERSDFNFNQESLQIWSYHFGVDAGIEKLHQHTLSLLLDENKLITLHPGSHLIEVQLREAFKYIKLTEQANRQSVQFKNAKVDQILEEALLRDGWSFALLHLGLAFGSEQIKLKLFAANLVKTLIEAYDNTPKLSPAVTYFINDTFRTWKDEGNKLSDHQDFLAHTLDNEFFHRYNPDWNLNREVLMALFGSDEQLMILRRQRIKQLTMSSVEEIQDYFILITNPQAALMEQTKPVKTSLDQAIEKLTPRVDFKAIHEDAVIQSSLTDSLAVRGVTPEVELLISYFANSDTIRLYLLSKIETLLKSAFTREDVISLIKLIRGYSGQVKPEAFLQDKRLQVKLKAHLDAHGPSEALEVLLIEYANDKLLDKLRLKQFNYLLIQDEPQETLDYIFSIGKEVILSEEPLLTQACRPAQIALAGPILFNTKKADKTIKAWLDYSLPSWHYNREVLAKYCGDIHHKDRCRLQRLEMLLTDNDLEKSVFHVNQLLQIEQVGQKHGGAKFVSADMQPAVDALFQKYFDEPHNVNVAFLLEQFASKPLVQAYHLKRLVEIASGEGRPFLIEEESDETTYYPEKYASVFGEGFSLPEPASISAAKAEFTDYQPLSKLEHLIAFVGEHNLKTLYEALAKDDIATGSHGAENLAWLKDTLITAGFCFKVVNHDDLYNSRVKFKESHYKTKQLSIVRQSIRSQILRGDFLRAEADYNRYVAYSEFQPFYADFVTAIENELFELFKDYNGALARLRQAEFLQLIKLIKAIPLGEKISDETLSSLKTFLSSYSYKDFLSPLFKELLFEILGNEANVTAYEGSLNRTHTIAREVRSYLLHTQDPDALTVADNYNAIFNEAKNTFMAAEALTLSESANAVFQKMPGKFHEFFQNYEKQKGNILSKWVKSLVQDDVQESLKFESEMLKFILAQINLLPSDIFSDSEKNDLSRVLESLPEDRRAEILKDLYLQIKNFNKSDVGFSARKMFMIKLKYLTSVHYSAVHVSWESLYREQALSLLKHHYHILTNQQSHEALTRATPAHYKVIRKLGSVFAVQYRQDVINHNMNATKAAEYMHHLIEQLPPELMPEADVKAIIASLKNKEAIQTALTNLLSAAKQTDVLNALDEASQEAVKNNQQALLFILETLTRKVTMLTGEHRFETLQTLITEISDQYLKDINECTQFILSFNISAKVKNSAEKEQLAIQHFIRRCYVFKNEPQHFVYARELAAKQQCKLMREYVVAEIESLDVECRQKALIELRQILDNPQDLHEAHFCIEQMTMLVDLCQRAKITDQFILQQMRDDLWPKINWINAQAAKLEQQLEGAYLTPEPYVQLDLCTLDLAYLGQGLDKQRKVNLKARLDSISGKLDPNMTLVIREMLMLDNDAADLSQQTLYCERLMILDDTLRGLSKGKKSYHESLAMLIQDLQHRRFSLNALDLPYYQSLQQKIAAETANNGSITVHCLTPLVNIMGEALQGTSGGVSDEGQIGEAIALAEMHEPLLDKYFLLLKQCDALKDGTMKTNEFQVSVKGWDLLFKGLPTERKMTLIHKMAALKIDFPGDKALLVKLNFIENLIHVQQPQAVYQERWRYLQKFDQILFDLDFCELLSLSAEQFLYVVSMFEKVSLVSDKQFFIYRLDALLAKPDNADTMIYLLTTLRQILTTSGWTLDQELSLAYGQYQAWANAQYEVDVGDDAAIDIVPPPDKRLNHS